MKFRISIRIRIELGSDGCNLWDWCSIEVGAHTVSYMLYVLLPVFCRLSSFCY